MDVEPVSYADWREHRTCSRKTRRYDTQLDANTAVLHLWRQGKKAAAYRCEYCGFWHLTTHPEETP